MNTEEEDRAEELFAEGIADEALLGFAPLLPKAAYQEMRALIVDDLLCSDEGRRRLRAARKDPVVQQSTEVDRRGDEPAPGKASKAK